MMKGRNQTLLEPIKATYWEDIYNVNEVISNQEFITGQEVHVWLAPLNSSIKLYDILSPEERDKAARFRLIRDQNQYIVSHGILRQIIGAYCNEDPYTLILKKTRYGKPFIDSKNRRIAIKFNMSHSENVACYVISSKYEVGIDIEYVKPDFEWPSIAQVYLSPSEVTKLESLPEKVQTKAFFTNWTQKEALLKALGSGLNDLDELVRNDSNSKFKKYATRSFNYEGQYQGALAVSSKFSKVKYFRLIT